MHWTEAEKLERAFRQAAQFGLIAAAIIGFLGAVQSQADGIAAHEIFQAIFMFIGMGLLVGFPIGLVVWAIYRIIRFAVKG